MSTYQYYEFQAIDRPLTPEEQQAVSQLSSRVAPHPRQAIFTYHWGSFSGRSTDVLAKYYDALFYIANWGSVQLAFRFPKPLIDVQQIEPYYVDDYVTYETRGEHVILNMEIHEERGYGWVEGEGHLDNLLPLRNDILNRDYRVLYLAWLATWHVGGITDESHEPPVPAGLKSLTPALQAFIDLFQIDEHLVTAAAQASAARKESTIDFRQAIAGLSHEEREAWLLRLAQNEAHLGIAFQHHLMQTIPPQPQRQHGHRTVSELLEVAEEEQERALQRQIVEAEAKRIRELEALAPKAEDMWTFASQLIEQSNARAYDKAVELLRKLYDLAIYQGREAMCEERIGRIRQNYQRRRSLINRLDEAGLP